MNQNNFIEKNDKKPCDKNNLENSFRSLRTLNLIKNNIKGASELLETNNLNAALDLLNENLRLGAKDSKTYDLLLYIYKRQNDYAMLIKVLNAAIKSCPRKNKIYRQIKKDLLLKKIIEDMEEI